MALDWNKVKENVNKALDAFRPKNYRQMTSYSVDPEKLEMNYNTWHDMIELCKHKGGINSPLSCIEVITNNSLRDYEVYPILD